MDLWRHPANRHCRVRALSCFVNWQLRKRLFHRSVDIDYHGQRLICYPDSHSSSAAIYFNGLPDHWEMRFVQDYLKDGDGFLDIGANIGLYMLLARSRVGKTGFVDAFEPLPSTASRLEAQVSLNAFKNVTVHRLVACDRNDVVFFGLSTSDSLMHVRREGERNIDDCWRLPGVRLDDCVADRAFDMGKMDIEGCEPLAMAGAEIMLADRNPPVWLVEVAGYSKLYGVPTHTFIEWMRSRGFEPAIYDTASKKLVPVDQPWRGRSTNVLFIASNHKDGIQSRLSAWRDK